MIRWTSPVLTLTVGGIDLSSADVWLTNLQEVRQRMAAGIERGAR